MFTFDSVDDNDPYVDYFFIDTSIKSLRRIWTATFNREDNSWYGNLRRSETDIDEFGDVIDLPKKLVDVLVSSIPDGELLK